MWPQWQLCPVIYKQNVITTMTWTEFNYPRCLPVSQFATSFLRLLDPDATDWNQVSQLLSLPRHYIDISSIWVPAASPCSSRRRRPANISGSDHYQIADLRMGQTRWGSLVWPSLSTCSPVCWIWRVNSKTFSAAVDSLVWPTFWCVFFAASTIWWLWEESSIGPSNLASLWVVDVHKTNKLVCILLCLVNCTLHLYTLTVLNPKK